MKRIYHLLVLLLLLNSILVVAQETDDIYEAETVEECGIGCKIWQFLFGSKEARAGKAWWDRGALVGEAGSQTVGWDCTNVGGALPYSCVCKSSVGCFDENKVWYADLEPTSHQQDLHQLQALGQVVIPSSRENALTIIRPEDKEAAQDYFCANSNIDSCRSLALAYVAVGEDEKAVAYLSKACNAGSQESCKDFLSYNDPKTQNELKTAAQDPEVKKTVEGLKETGEIPATISTETTPAPGAQSQTSAPTAGTSGTAAPRTPADTEAAKALHAEGTALYDAGKYDEAIKKWEAAYEKDPSPLILYNIGNAYKKQGNSQKAKETYQNFLNNYQKLPAGARNANANQAAKTTAETYLKFQPGLQNNEALAEIKDILGANYKVYDKQISGANEFFEQVTEEGEPRVLILRKTNTKTGELQGLVQLTENPDTGVWTGEVTKVAPKGGGFKEETIFVKNQQVIATKTAPGTIKIGNEPFTVDKDATGKEIFSKEGLFYQVEEEEDGGNIKYNPEDDTRTITNYIDETQDVYDTKTGEQSKLKGDSYIDGQGGCKEDRCFVPTGGHETRLVGKDKKEKPIYDSYLVDYDYRDLTGADRIESLEAKGYFNPRSGRKEGETFHHATADGDVVKTTVVAQREHDEKGKETGKYTGNLIIEDKELGEAILTRSGEEGPWKAASLPKLDAIVEQKSSIYEVARKSSAAAFNDFSLKKTALDNKQGELNLRKVELSKAIAEKKIKSGSNEEKNELALQQQLEQEVNVLQQEATDAQNALDAANNQFAVAGDELNQAQKEKDEAEQKINEEANEGTFKEHNDDILSSSQGGLATAQTILESIYAVSSQVKSYPAISNLLFGEAEFYQDWRRAQDAAFAPLLGENWFPSLLCEDST
ncbi:tetratricopeptide repeat protein, partial [Candidatus Woesearchaeota archaeon]|nr:tetratricopeptide repeat protein [Candidatus Woesearchaeota archaeon]